MINKIENWNNVEPNYGESKRIVAGGYICKIVACQTEKSKAGKEMLVVNFDIAEGDFKDFYYERYKNAPRNQNSPQEPKWGGKYYILLEGENYEGRLKAFITSVEESNAGYTWDWDEKSLKGKLFGGIFREEEFEYYGQIFTNAKLWQIRSVATIRNGEFEIPRKKEYVPSTQEMATQMFQPITDDDLPF